MNANEQRALATRLTALGDDELILGHRGSEWTGHAPVLEEDIALANIAQDEIGHAVLWYQAKRELDGTDPDRLVYFREAEHWRNVKMVELPRGDWAFTMLRQFLFDSYELLLYEQLARSSVTALRETAAKIAKEERFHLQHTGLWVERLGLGTETSHQRLANALSELWPHVAQLFVITESDEVLVSSGALPELAELKDRYLELTSTRLAAANLRPDATNHVAPARSEHTSHLSELLAELQDVARLEPEGTPW